MTRRHILSIISLLLLFTSKGYAETACSKVSLEILQELTLERVAFDAKLVITNNIPDKDLNNIRVDVIIKDANDNIKNDIFYMRVSSKDNIDSVDGDGTVRAGTSAEVHWIIIPSAGAGGEEAAGKIYYAGATLTYTIDEHEEVVPINPDRITVKPSPQLVLDYFMPYDVIGDNPFTTQVEAPVSFPLAVRVLNDGYGTATKLKIDSAQPKIVDNKQGLLVDFKLLGASVNDSLVSTSLNVDFGDLGSKKIAKGSWEMISTLTGRFKEFGVTFSHASELGGELTSLIKETNAYYLTHLVKVNLTGRDGYLDILADTDRDPDYLPDAIFESEIPGGSNKREDAKSPVKVVAALNAPPRPTAQAPKVELKVATGDSGWIYSRLSDPGNGLLNLTDVVRADGVHLDPHNFWISEGVDKDYKQTFTLHILDYRGDANVTGTYTLVYEKPSEDTTPPTTSIIYDGPSLGSSPTYITPQTRIVFSAKDNGGGSGVEQMKRKVSGQDSDFVPAFPMNLDESGSASIEYYSIDKAGNQEETKTLSLYVDNEAPVIETFRAEPASFTPTAPRGVEAARGVDFVIKATDSINSLPVTVEISDSSTGNVIRTLTGTAASGFELKITWDGKDGNGLTVPTGTYTAKVGVTDGLDNKDNTSAPSHTSTSTISIEAKEWFTGTPVDPNLSGEQQHPKAAGTKVVWQDNRNGNWDIYFKDLTGGTSKALSTDTHDQTYPSISGNIVVWQDNRNGNWDIYGYDLNSSHEFAVSTDTGNQERPVISGEWVSWQDNGSGNYDIYAYNLTTHEKIQITNHERDQMHAVIDGSIIAWEDYRHGLGEIYKYDLVSRTETRITVNIYSQTYPALSENTLVWTDNRNGDREIYAAPDSRVTYGTSDQAQASVFEKTIVYTDYEAGQDDPNLAFYDLTSGTGGLLSTNPAKQEEASLADGIVVWQDNRDGVWQIYKADFKVEPVPIQIELQPGFNLVSVGSAMTSSYPTASFLIQAYRDDVGIERVLSLESLHGTYYEAVDAGSGANIMGSDFALTPGMGLVVYAARKGTLTVADSGEAATYTLLPGTNQIGMLTAPAGYRAYDMMISIGLDNVQGVRRFNTETGLWETASVRVNDNGNEPVGANFQVMPGEGLIVTMKNRVDGWRP